MILNYKIKEEELDGRIPDDELLITPCPFRKNVKIGSNKCYKCKYYVNDDDETNQLECNHPTK
jgi:hypothetical protein